MLIKILLGFLTIILLFNCSAVFAAGPWKGKVIDIETKEPLDGAVVLAVWERVYRTPAGDNSYFYEAKEVLTDKEGRFEIPAYTPINLLPLISYMRGPHFIIFKPAYLSIEWWHEEYFLEGSTKKAVELPEREKTFRISANLLELPKLKTREERIKVLPSIPGVFYESGFSGKLRRVVPEEKIKNLIRLLNIEEKELGLEPTKY